MYLYKTLIIIILDWLIKNSKGTTKFVRPPRSSAKPSYNINNATFDKYNDLNGWYTEFQNYKWEQMNGNLSSALGRQGPGSDYKSISSLLINMTNLFPLNSKCSIPYCVDKEQYYCRRLPGLNRKDLGCLYHNCSVTLNRNESNYGKCDLGYYIMITSDKFQTESGSMKSRIFSPVYSQIKNLCCKFYYNIYGSDGFYFYIEQYDYLSENIDYSRKLFEKFGFLKYDKWYEVNVQLNNIPFEQFRVKLLLIILIQFRKTKIYIFALKFYFQPIKRANKRNYSSISLDSILFNKGKCEFSGDSEFIDYDFDLTSSFDTISDVESTSDFFFSSLSENEEAYTHKTSSSSHSSSLSPIESEISSEQSTNDYSNLNELTTFSNSQFSFTNSTTVSSLDTTNEFVESTTYYSIYTNTTVDSNNEELMTSSINYDTYSSYKSSIKDLVTYFIYNETTEINNLSTSILPEIKNSTQTSTTTITTSFSTINETQKAKVELVKIIVPIFSVIIGLAFISFIFHILYKKGKLECLIRLFRKENNIVQPS